MTEIYKGGTDMRQASYRTELIGNRFGLLTVIENTGETQDRYALWRCKCDCGGEILVNTKRLKRGTITNCGCIPRNEAKRGSLAEDLTGKVFGRLTVLNRAENQYGRVYWNCRCACGNEKTVSAQSLKSGSTTSCGYGCGSKAYPYIKLQGTVKGFIKVLEQTDRRDDKGSIIWRCICLRCGNECFYSADVLRNGRSVSCGCYRQEIICKNVHDRLRFDDGTCVEWLKYRKSRCDNTSGFRGVNQTKSGRYRAFIGFKRKTYIIGTYQTFAEAVKNRLEAEELIHNAFVLKYESWEKQARMDPEWGKRNPVLFDVRKIDGELVVVTDSAKTIGRERI